MEQSYKEKYEQALSKAKDMLNYKEVRREDMEYLFPELKESEDEKVRKALIDFFNKGAKNGAQTNGVYDKDILAWLEKQGKTSPVLSNSSNIGKVEQNPNWSEEDEEHIDSLLKRLDALCRNKFECTRFAISEDRDWLKSIKERKGGKI